MKVILEGSVQGKQDWINSLSLSDEEFLELLERGILANKGAKKFTCDFVGEVITKNEYIVSLPKCYKETLHPNHIDITLTNRVLKKYYYHKSTQAAVVDQDLNELHFLNDNSSAEYEVFLTLKKYTNSFGIYKSKVGKNLKGYNRKTNWKKTIKNSVALHDDGSLIYLDPVNSIHIDIFNEVSEIFYSVLMYLNSKYSLNYLKNHFHVTGLNIIQPKTIFKNTASLGRKIELEMAKTFNTEDLNVLKILNEYLSNNLKHTGNTSIKAFGTSSFHVIWEVLCKTAFKDDFQNLISKISQPVWLKENSEVVKSNGNLTPDVLTQDTNSYYILDAKYYYPYLTKQCGVGDIAKQYIYGRAFSMDTKEVRNAFLFPSISPQKIQNCGRVGMLQANGEPNALFANDEIKVFQLDYNSLAIAYLGQANIEEYLNELKSYWDTEE